MKISDVIECGAVESIEVELESACDPPPSNPITKIAHPHTVTISVWTVNIADQQRHLLWSTSARGKNAAGCAELVLAELEKWLGGLTRIHATAVAMRRMLVKGTEEKSK